GAHVVREDGGGVEDEVTERVVEVAVSHRRAFRRSPARSCEAGLGGCRGGLARRLRLRGSEVAAEPLAPVRAHVLDQRNQSLALGGERVLDARRHLREGAPVHDALLLELAEAAAPGGEVTDDEDRPLAADQVGGGADRTGIQRFALHNRESSGYFT